ncbi:DUF2690 domain-containing protein [Streptomyces sp. BE308]|uniref:helix-turn-helix domain-containing protein n=1 Tax=Streptomyces sp. BE308 TaxID=3002529 RepID=UPI002E789460|nr:DUF2690 domain-containing protein [Streptomyces sp. BE308]MEE1793658.1 DUF2690 domain-containing protein [Streptomyces sp. BE308]
MPRWKALPEELDPQIREFASQLRRLVDRGGLSIAAVADRTGYSKTSWERYLNGRLLAPKRAVLALAEVTGTDQNHLSVMWELAERAWSRSEMRHDRTMETIRITEARAALGEFGTVPAAGAGPGAHDAARSPSVPVQRGTVSHIPHQPRSPHHSPPQSGPQPPNHSGRRGRPAGRRKPAVVVAGVVGVLLVVTAAVLLTGLGGDDGEKKTTTPPSAAPTTGAAELPDGVECSGADCTGQDPEAMGCGGQYARTVASAVVGGSRIEVRFSEPCSAVWARITEAATGDTVRINAGKAEQDGTVDADRDAYTPMVSVKKADDAKACATLASGTKGCTVPQA